MIQTLYEIDENSDQYTFGKDYYKYDEQSNCTSLIEVDGDYSVRDETYHKYYFYDDSNKLESYIDTFFITNEPYASSKRNYFFNKKKLIDSTYSSIWEYVWGSDNSQKY